MRRRQRFERSVRAQKPLRLASADAMRQCPYADCRRVLADVHLIRFWGAWSLWRCANCRRDVVVRHHGYPGVLNMWTLHVPGSANLATR